MFMVGGLSGMQGQQGKGQGEQGVAHESAPMAKC